MALSAVKDVEAYQRLRIGPDGDPLAIDGDIGPETQWALDLDALPHWRMLLVLAGLKWRGLVETGVNDGPEVGAWLKACRARPGIDPWCAAFASMCIRAAGFECREASVHRLCGMFTEVAVPLPADLCALLRPDGTGHVDIVTGCGYDRVSVVGGNVGNAVRCGLRLRAGRRFFRVSGNGVPAALATLPLLGAESR